MPQRIISECKVTNVGQLRQAVSEIWDTYNDMLSTSPILIRAVSRDGEYKIEILLLVGGVD